LQGLKKKSIWLLTDTLLVNGWGLYTKSIEQALTELGIDVYIFTYANRIPPDIKNKENVIKLLTISFVNKAYLKLLIRLYKPSVVHFCSEPIGKLLASLKNENKIITIHGTYGHIFRTDDKHFSKVVFDSSYTFNKFNTLFNSKKFIIFPVSTLISSLKKNSISTNVLKEDQSIIYIGNSKYRKGFELLLEAYIRIKAKYPTASLAIVGKLNSAHIDLLKYVKDVEFFESIDQISLIKLIQRKKVNVLPSRTELKNGIEYFEGFGLVHLESIILGTYSIGSLNSGNEDIILHRVTGSLIKEGDVSSLIEELEYAFNFSYNSHELIKIAYDKFSFEQFKANLKELYEI
jgi:glycosyltransferase involved in cell wall biosynthesis